ncbi:MAG: helix-turn-helix transcriptional regulator [Chloroflexi bacterium]|nr:helix-turn-helix transcriptional regulator [Chloroflexota bacterium]
MIKNERQYRITRTQAERFTRTLEGLRSRPERADGVHPVIAQAQVDAVSSQLADLEAELREYEAVRDGRFEVEALREAVNLPELLIKARIAQGLTQKELADRLGLKEQQIQRYEATDYAAAKWSRIREVAGELSKEVYGSAQALEIHR